MNHTEYPFQRTELLLGARATERLAHTRVIIFGVGGVGSWCAEALARCGVGTITLIDSDAVAPSNINRQLVALTSTVGQSKVQVMAQRILDINPACRVKAVEDRYTPDNGDTFHLADYDYVIDAIDSLADKAHLILTATSLKGVKLFSSMGAALKTDAGQIAVAEFWNVKGCPLARALRQWFKRTGQYPRRKFKCVYSPQLVKNKEGGAQGPMPNGTVVFATAPFGLRLAQLVVADAVATEAQGVDN